MKKVLIFLLFVLGVQIASAQVQQVPKEFEGLWVQKQEARDSEGKVFAPPLTDYVMIKNYPDGISIKSKRVTEYYVSKNWHPGYVSEPETLYQNFTNVRFEDGKLYGCCYGRTFTFQLKTGVLHIDNKYGSLTPPCGIFYNENDNW